MTIFTDTTERRREYTMATAETMTPPVGTTTSTA
jgi:hypothetical protein